ncbi:antibiotic biosynthesis monooxygenase [Nocardia bovistercoris]|uniref:Antibiotic biosynthesis monooxygenase n=1 Tax=Nocardia bovistercoris TaxID=2785916 RepID=A0A931N5I4_9NOCA|nr:antibiotic biosynthesis monooxygenase [Nocardia bovistercoris]MBH0779884.1 antibiotic biosynthesis monooxygenase [Nocardia bovistercoris]
MSATAVTVFHPPADLADFRAWLPRFIEIASAVEGFEKAARAVSDEPLLAPGLGVTFRTEAQAHEFLDSRARAAVLAEGQRRGFLRGASDLVIVAGQTPPPGIGVFRHSVAAGREADFVATEVRLVTLSASFPGFDGAALFGDGGPGEWYSVLRFRTPGQLATWMGSAQRAEALPALRSELTEDFLVEAHTTPFGSTLRTVNGRTEVTPTWKIAMLVLLVLYPTVMTLSRFLGPVLDAAGAPPWLAMWLSQIVSVAAMSWVLSPVVAWCFRRWLDPVDGAGGRASLAGAGVVIVLYALTLLLFASVTWLQYWDYDN